MMRGGSFLGGFEIKPPNEQAMELPKPQDTKSIPESSSELGETIDLHDERHEELKTQKKRVRYSKSTLLMITGNEITDKEGKLKPISQYSLLELNIRPMITAILFCIDGNHFAMSPCR
jgi:hypothetical protein